MGCDMESKSIEELDKMEILRKNYIVVRHPRMKRILRIQASIGKAIREYLDGQGFIELLPPIIGPATDPGIRGASCLLYTSPSPRDRTRSRMPSSA